MRGEATRDREIGGYKAAAAYGDEEREDAPTASLLCVICTVLHTRSCSSPTRGVAPLSPFCTQVSSNRGMTNGSSKVPLFKKGARNPYTGAAGRKRDFYCQFPRNRKPARRLPCTSSLGGAKRCPRNRFRRPRPEPTCGGGPRSRSEHGSFPPSACGLA